MFNTINKLLRSKCFNCHKLKIKDKLIIYYYLKLSLIKLGYLGDAKYLDSLLYSTVCPNNNILGIYLFKIDIINEFFQNKEMNINLEEVTVSTEEANTVEMMDNTDDVENDDEEDELSEDNKGEQGQNKKKIKKVKKEKLDFKKLEKPLTELKIQNITRILEKLNHKVDSFDTDLNMKIMLR